MSAAGLGAWITIPLIAIAVAVPLLSSDEMAPQSSALRSTCTVDRATLTAPGCRLVRSDTGNRGGPIPLWGEVACASKERHRRKRERGDPHLTAAGHTQPDASHRRLAIREGDDVFGQRCELGRNDHRFGQDGGPGTFQLYREGQRKLTFLSLRILPDTPLQGEHWQVVMQMKQTQPADNGGYSPVLALNLVDGRWALIREDSPGPGELADSDVLWSTRARKDVWTRFAFDVTYSQHASKGRIKVFVDLNGDSDVRDRQEVSRTFRGATLKYETPDPAGQQLDVDGLAPGESIPSHLRVGLYQDQAYSCFGINRSRCAIAVDNMQVVTPR